MVKRCSHGLCNSDDRYLERLEGGKVKFVPFPKPKTQYDKCLRWIKLCGRSHGQLSPSKINKNKYVFEGPMQENRLCLADVAERTIHKLGWRREAVIYDRENVCLLQNLREVKSLVYEIDDDSSLRSMLQEIHTTLFPEVNVVVAVDGAMLLRKIITEVDRFDILANHSTDFSHHSKWLVFTEELSVFLYGRVRIANLQNLALVSYRFQPTVCLVETLTLRSVAREFRFRPVDQTLSFPLMMFPNTQYGYNRRSLRVSTAESTPFVISSMGRVDIPFVGICIDILDIIINKLNMTVEYVPAHDGTWGWNDTGMIGQLKRREIDLAASDLAVHSVRTRHVDFIKSHLYMDERVFTYKMPAATKPIFLLAGPLNPEVYLVYGGVTFVVIMLIIFMDRTAGFTQVRQNRRNGSLFWELIKPPFKQGIALHILNTPSRVLLIFWWLLVMLIGALYCGNLTATLAANTPLRKFQYVDELADSDFEVGFMNGGIAGLLFQTSTRKDVKRLYAKFVRMNASGSRLTTGSKDELLQNVKEGRYAYLSYKSLVEHVVKGDCSLSTLSFGEEMKTPLAFAVQKNSPFRDDIDKVMESLDWSGLLIMMWEKWSNQTQTRTCGSGTGGVTMVKLIGAMIVVSAGVGLASISLFFERWFAWYRQK